MQLIISRYWEKRVCQTQCCLFELEHRTKRKVPKEKKGEVSRVHTFYFLNSLSHLQHKNPCKYMHMYIMHSISPASSQIRARKLSMLYIYIYFIVSQVSQVSQQMTSRDRRWWFCGWHKKIGRQPAIASHSQPKIKTQQEEEERGRKKMTSLKASSYLRCGQPMITIPIPWFWAKSLKGKCEKPKWFFYTHIACDGGWVGANLGFFFPFLTFLYFSLVVVYSWYKV